jgi:2,3-bisphosphoglycerate-dependent phosphoglycerate mutase
MNIYFVRHGQTKFNEIKTEQGDGEPLSPIGRHEAEMIAERAQNLTVEAIYASPIERAAQTAQTIGQAIQKEIIYSDLLAEQRRPSILVGERTNSPLMCQIYDDCAHHQGEPQWHHSDEENFIEYRARIRQAIEFLESRPQKNLLVVSHGNFIKTLILTITFGDNFTFETMRSFIDGFRLKNTGLTYCHKNDLNRWSVEAFNDHRHLG